MNINLILTKNYEEQQKPGKKTKPIYCSNSLILSEKSMIPSYKKYAKQSQFENDSDVRYYCINKRLQPIGHLVSWEKQTQNKPNGMLYIN